MPIPCIPWSKGKNTTVLLVGVGSISSENCPRLAGGWPGDRGCQMPLSVEVGETIKTFTGRPGTRACCGNTEFLTALFKLG